MSGLKKREQEALYREQMGADALDRQRVKAGGEPVKTCKCGRRDPISIGSGLAERIGPHHKFGCPMFKWGHELEAEGD